ncbi:MAG: O-antigen ligase family protein [Bdellovibrio sp.]
MIERQTTILSFRSHYFWSLILSFCAALNLINFYWLDIFFVLIFLAGSWQVVRNRATSFTTEFNFKLNIFNILVLIFLSSGILGYILSSPMGKEQWNDIVGLRWVLGFYAFYYLGRQFRIHKNKLSIFSFFPLITLLYILTKHWIFAGGKLANPNVRLQGFYQNPNHFALAVALLWAFIVGLTVIKDKSKANFVLNLLTSVVIAISLIATYSRSAWAGAGFAFIAALYCVKSRKLYYVGSGLAVTTALILLSNSFGLKDRLLYSFDMSSTSAQNLRTTVWKVAWQIFIDHPFFGVGFAENARLFPEYYAKLGFSSNDIVGNTHNQYLEILSGAGIFGLIAYLGIFVVALRYLQRKFKSADTIQGKQISLGAILTIVALIISSITDTPFRLHEARNYLMILLGFSFGYLDLEKKTSVFTISDQE